MTPRLSVLSRVALGFVAPILLMAAWFTVRATHRIPDYILPAPATVLARLWRESSGGFLTRDLCATLQRVLEGFALGTSFGLIFGLSLGTMRSIEKLVGPLFIAYRQIAPFAWIPLLALWFGGGESGKLAFVALSAFAPSAVHTWRAVRAVPASYHELAAALTLNPLDELRLIALPGAVPGILTGVRLSLVYAWVATIGAELFLDIAPGLGSRLNEARDKFEIDLMLATLLTLATTGLVFNQLAAFAERKLLRANAR